MTPQQAAIEELHTTPEALAAKTAQMDELARGTRANGGATLDIQPKPRRTRESGPNEHMRPQQHARRLRGRPCPDVGGDARTPCPQAEPVRGQGKRQVPSREAQLALLEPQLRLRVPPGR
jgi:hypothetical protein